MAIHSVRGWRYARLLLFITPLQATALAGAPAELTLAAAEQRAVSADPAVLARRSRAFALQDQAVADGQLPDPKLLLSVWNVPLDDFSMEKESMSQLRAGVSQSFPRGDSLRYRRQRTEWLGKAETAAMRNTRAEIRRDVRLTFLELYYQEQALRLVAQSRGVFNQLVTSTRAHYGAGRGNQQDVLQAQLELSRLDDRLSRVNEQRDLQRAALARWLGELARLPLAPRFPVLPELTDQSSAAASLSEHPAIEAANAEIEARRQSVREAREQYKPGLDIGVQYLKRFGDNNDGSNRPDQVAALLTLDLPVFTEKRQDRRLSASQQNAEAAVQEREQVLRELQRALTSDYARWQRLGEQETLYRDRLLREATANGDAALNAYRNGTGDFATLVRARITELDIQLQEMRIRVDRAKSRARLLYLVPGPAATTMTLEGAPS